LLSKNEGKSQSNQDFDRRTYDAEQEGCKTGCHARWTLSKVSSLSEVCLAEQRRICQQTTNFGQSPSGITAGLALVVVVVVVGVVVVAEQQQQQKE
jgi:hypothetical protein